MQTAELTPGRPWSCDWPASADARLAVTVDRDGPRRRRRGLYAVFLAPERVRHVVVLGAAVRCRLAATHVLRVDLIACTVARDLGAGKRASYRAHASRQVVASAATDLVAEHATEDAANHGATNLIAAARQR